MVASLFASLDQPQMTGVEKIEDPWHIAHMVWLFLLGLHPAGSLIQLPVIRRRCFEKPAVPVAVAQASDKPGLLLFIFLLQFRRDAVTHVHLLHRYGSLRFRGGCKKVFQSPVHGKARCAVIRDKFLIVKKNVFLLILLCGNQETVTGSQIQKNSSRFLSPLLVRFLNAAADPVKDPVKPFFVLRRRPGQNRAQALVGHAGHIQIHSGLILHAPHRDHRHLRFLQLSGIELQIPDVFFPLFPQRPFHYTAVPADRCRHPSFRTTIRRHYCVVNV